MDKKELFIKYMGEVANVALATCVDGVPNVRSVSIGFDGADPGTFYFMTDPGSEKVKEMQLNPQVTFIPLPDKANTDVMIRARGTAAPAGLSFERLAELIGRHLPEFAAQIPAMAVGSVIYQVRYGQAEVSLGMNAPEIITF